MPAAHFTTPAYVIKTRVQVEARKSQSTYDGTMGSQVQLARTSAKRDSVPTSRVVLLVSFSSVQV